MKITGLFLRQYQQGLRWVAATALLNLALLVVLVVMLQPQLHDWRWQLGLIAASALNILLLLPCAFGKSWLTELRQLDTEVAELELNLNQLMQDAHLPLAQQESLTLKLLRISKNQQAQARREQEIRHLVRVQGLIDHDLAIGNRIYFESKLQHFLKDPEEPEQGALFLLQISHPEAVVDPATALQRLAGCAELLTQLTSHFPLAVLARLAEQDIAILLPGMQQKEAAAMGERMAAVLSRSNYFADYPDFDVLHLGYVIYQQGQQAYQLMAEADMALKTAQLQGPNGAFGFYDHAKPKIKGSVWWRTELSNALNEQRLLLSFQPVFSWEQRDVIQHEVLVRLQSSEGDKLNAGVFLPMAANCGLCLAIDQYVVLKAARLCQAENIAGSLCSVNLSVQSLLSPDWQPWLSQLLQSGQLKAGQFAFELDEYHLLKHYQALKPKLQQLHQLGFRLIVDHVGLSIEACPYLDELPLEAIKLHPSVVRHLDQQLEQQLFVRGLIASNVAKGVRVIASGVEHLAEWQTLQKLGVSGAQGYYFSQPLARIIPVDQPS